MSDDEKVEFEPPLFELPLTANQVVAYNLARARALRGWTQDQAAEHLEEQLHVRWSRSSWSTAERSAGGGRTRKFDAEEILAFSQTFGLPVAWFFLPPGADRPDLSREFQALFLVSQLGDPEMISIYTSRFQQLLDWADIPSKAPQLLFERIIERATNSRNQKELARFRETLLSLLGAVEHVEEDEQIQAQKWTV